jgi:hypothetical protein
MNFEKRFSMQECVQFEIREKGGRYKYSGLLKQEKYKYNPKCLKFAMVFVRNSKS